MTGMSAQPGEMTGTRTAPAGTLLLVRHGQSLANAQDRFAGWLDVPLTARGEAEALRAAELIGGAAAFPDVVHTSVLTRSIRTADIVLDALGRSGLPTFRTWRLNERHYGALQGRHKAEVRAEVSEDTYQWWRRAFRGRPPAAAHDGGLAGDPRYADVPPGALPRAESLQDVATRLLPYWEEVIGPELTAGRTVLVVAHGSPLRALIMHLEGISEDGIAAVNVPTGIPLRFDFDTDLRPLAATGVYLDPAAAAAGAAEVAAQGGGPPAR